MARATPLLYAHRGAAVEAPENTLEAFDLALDLGADAIETDAHLTSDGMIVLSHDPTGERMVGAKTPIEDVTFDEVRQWDAGARFVDAQGESPFRGRGLRMPTLEEALLHLPHTRFNVDAKSVHPAMAVRIVDLVHRLRAEDRVRLASFDSRNLQAIRRLGYRGETGLAQAEVVRLLLAPSAVLRRMPPGGTAAQLPHRMFGLDVGDVRVVRKCHALGLVVHYWTVNDEPRAAELLARGADGIMTDDPRALAPLFARVRSGAMPGGACGGTMPAQPHDVLSRKARP